MGTPSKIDILLRAREITGACQFRHGLPSISAEEHELKESGTFNEARRQIMGRKSEIRSQQERYVRNVADEIGLAVVPKTDYRKFLKFQMAPIPKAVKNVVPNAAKIFLTSPAPSKRKKKQPKKTKKPKKRHTQRNGKTMKSLRSITGVKVFSFPDSVWKVKQPRRRKKMIA